MLSARSPDGVDLATSEGVLESDLKTQIERELMPPKADRAYHQSDRRSYAMAQLGAAHELLRPLDLQSVNKEH